MLKFNKGLAPSFNVARVGKANLPFSGRLYLPLNGECNPPTERRSPLRLRPNGGTSCLSYMKSDTYPFLISIIY